jgi:putative tryptophan/tyrosine transport system substrate-binding protein
MEIARSVGAEPFSVSVSAGEQIAGAFADMTGRKADAVIVVGTPLFSLKRSEIVELAARHRLPALYDNPAIFVPIGGLLGYGADVTDLFRRATTYVDKILKGAKPADLPIEQPTRFQLMINLKTAAALGLTVPQSLLARADEGG